MITELRRRIRHSCRSDVAPFAERPLLNITAEVGHCATDLQAICLNGRWFVPAESTLAAHYQREWRDLT